MKKILFGLSLTLILSACIEVPNQFEKLPPGPWRGVLKLSDQPLGKPIAEEFESDQKLTDYFELPFNFDVVYDEDNQMKLIVKNAEEEIVLTDLRYGRDPSTAKDTISIYFNNFDSHLDAFYEENFIEGFWRVPYRKNNYRIPFIAKYGDQHRFEVNKTIVPYDFSGRWKTVFAFDSEDAWDAIAEFTQEGDQISGTFMTETGDYRFLEGNVEGEKLKLSVFDGAHAFLFTAKVSNDTITGEFRSGSHYKTRWLAYRDDTFELTDPYSLTKVTSPEPVDFSFEALNGEKISLSDEAFKDKIKLVNIMGSWCPNCKDEILFLQKLKEQNPEIEIISIAFEKYRDKDKALEVLRRYKREMNITWPLLYGGYADKEETGKAFDFLDKIYSYPTLVIIDQNNQVKRIQTGFYGPATSKHDAFKKEFYSIINEIKN